MRDASRHKGRLGVYEVENIVDELLSPGPSTAAPDRFVSASMTIFMNPWVSLFSTARATCVIARLPTSKRFRSILMPAT